ncbi:MAG: serine hydrolase domain-containing protein [Planctomycetota bacterium]
MIRRASRLWPLAASVLFSAASAASQALGATAQLDCEAAADYSATRGGLAVLVYEKGELIFERYQNGHSKDRPQHIFSGTKSFAPMVALIAEKEGLLKLDEKVCKTITEWQDDELRSQITIRHLLNFTSGLENNDNALHSPRIQDAHAASVACRAAHSPGARFRYGSNHLMVFGELLNRKLRAAEPAKDSKQPPPKDFVDYLDQRILQPIDCRYTKWIRDRKGHPALPFGAYLTAREWAKFGLLVLHRGKHEGQQIVPTAHFDECFRGSKANPRYGLNFWLIGADVHKRDEAIPADTATAAGMFGQKLYLMPSKDLLVVRLAKTGTRRRINDLKFLSSLFGG